MNFARDVVDAAPLDRRAFVEISREGGKVTRAVLRDDCQG